MHHYSRAFIDGLVGAVYNSGDSISSQRTYEFVQACMRVSVYVRVHVCAQADISIRKWEKNNNKLLLIKKSENDLAKKKIVDYLVGNEKQVTFKWANISIIGLAH